MIGISYHIFNKWNIKIIRMQIFSKQSVTKTSELDSKIEYSNYVLRTNVDLKYLILMCNFTEIDLFLKNAGSKRAAAKTWRKQWSNDYRGKLKADISDAATNNKLYFALLKDAIEFK